MRKRVKFIPLLLPTEINAVCAKLFRGFLVVRLPLKPLG